MLTGADWAQRSVQPSVPRSKPRRTNQNLRMGWEARRPLTTWRTGLRTGHWGSPDHPWAACESPVQGHQVPGVCCASPFPSQSFREAWLSVLMGL